MVDEPSAPQSAMIALLPMSSEWCRITLPHLTLVYAGETKDLKPPNFNDLAKDAASIAMLAKPITLQVTGKEVFGPELERVDVYTLRASTELLAMRRMVERWNKSEFPFNPHVTIGPPEPAKPDYMNPQNITFDRIMVGWGEETITFWLKHHRSAYAEPV